MERRIAPGNQNETYIWLLHHTTNVKGITAPPIVIQCPEPQCHQDVDGEDSSLPGSGLPISDSLQIRRRGLRPARADLGDFYHQQSFRTSKHEFPLMAEVDFPSSG